MTGLLNLACHFCFEDDSGKVSPLNVVTKQELEVTRQSSSQHHRSLLDVPLKPIVQATDQLAFMRFMRNAMP